MALILDVFRLKHAVSHPMLQRVWSDRDKEVRDGLVTVGDYYRPHVIVEFLPAERREKRFALGLRSSQGNSTIAERLLKKVFPQAPDEVRSAFLDAAWEALIEEGILVPSRLKERRGAGLQNVGPADGYQIDLNLIQLQYADHRWVCNRCRTSRGRSTPNGACPAFNCGGLLQLEPRDPDNFDVVQYTKFEFVPLLAREHSAQVPQEDRLQIERQFKKTGGTVNCLVATPTLEMGVDIGALEMVAMRNVPPSPANYAQRSGRAGRRHRIGVVMTYCRGGQHDQYFYADPPAMIAGSVRVPAFSMRNEPLIRKHVHSAILTFLRRIADEREREILQRAFPTYIWSWIAEETHGGRSKQLRLDPPDFSNLEGLVARHEDEVVANLVATFTRQWSEEDRAAVSEEGLRTMAREMPRVLKETVGRLMAEVKAYQAILREYAERENRGEVFGADENRRRDSYRAMRDRYLQENQENYALTYLATAGFFPGYALVRDSVRATSVQPPLVISRNLAVALRELTPANRLYANRRQFKVRRLDFYRLKADRPDFTPERLEKQMVLDTENKRILEPALYAVEGGERPGITFTSLQLIDVELDGLGRIGDQEEYRRLVGFRILPVLRQRHAGGHDGKVGTVPYSWRERAHLRLVNLGPTGEVPASPAAGTGQPHIGFPVCTVCGAVRSPFSSVAEIQNFLTWHTDRCGQEPRWVALHVDITSDVLILGPFDRQGDAINLLEAIRIGAQQVLEMGQQELELLILAEEDGRERGLMFDPFPGGSGLLPLVMEHWEPIVEEARTAMQRCTCERACYSCLLHFRNQQFHQVLDRFRAQDVLLACASPLQRLHDVSPSYADAGLGTDQTESLAEDRFLQILTKKGFPEPVPQFEVNLGGGTLTRADFAYPDRKVLIYVDGLSTGIHGNPRQQAGDRRKRTLARARGWNVLSISAQGLGDEAILSGFLDQLAGALGHEPEGAQ